MSSTVETTTEIRPFRFEVSDDELVLSLFNRD